MSKLLQVTVEWTMIMSYSWSRPPVEYEWQNTGEKLQENDVTNKMNSELLITDAKRNSEAQN